MGDTILVGHSTGAGFLIRYLSEHKTLHVGKVVLVAPFINPDNNPLSDTADFFDFVIDAEFPARTQGVVVFFSKNDEPSVRKTVDIVRATVHGLDMHEFNDKGHFTLESLGTVEFPELLSVVTSAEPVQP